MSNPISQLSDVAMRGLAELYHRDQRMKQAEAMLGRDAYLDTALEALRENLKALILNPETRENLEVAGQFGARVMMAEVVAKTRTAILVKAGLAAA